MRNQNHSRPTTLALMAGSSPLSKTGFLQQLILGFALIAFAGAAFAAPKNWAGPGPGTTSAPESGAWDTNSLHWNAASGAGDVAFAHNADGAVFGGPDGAYFIQCLTNLTATNITFSASGYTLTNHMATIITVNQSGAVTVPSGKTATIGSNVMISVTANPGIFNNGITAAGTLIIENGGTYRQPNTLGLHIDGAPGSTVRVMPGGTLAHNGGGSQFRVGLTSNAAPVVSVEGGTMAVTAVNPSIIIGVNNGATGTVDIAGGLISNANNNSINLGGGNGAVGTLNLNGGTVLVRNVIRGNAGATGIFNFNGGTLRAFNGLSAGTFMTGLTAANVRNGGAVIDNNGFSITIGQRLVHSTIGGDNAIDGGLTSIGTGTNTLTGTNTYTGPTVVSGGGGLRLTGNGSINNSASVTVSNSTFDVSGVSTQPTIAGELSLNDATLTVSLTNTAITGVITSATFTVGGSFNTIRVAALPLISSVPKQFTVVKYTTPPAPNVLDTVSLTLPTAQSPVGYLTNNTASNAIVLVITDAVLAPEISRQPASAARYGGYPASFTVELSVTNPPTGYQWRKGGSLLSNGGNYSGATTAVLTVSNISTAETGNYDVIVTNSIGSVTSSVAALTLVVPPSYSEVLGYSSNLVALGPVAYYSLNENGETFLGLPAYDYAGGFDGLYGTAVQNVFNGILGPETADGYPGLQTTGNEAVNGAAKFFLSDTNSRVTIAPSAWNFSTNSVTFTAWIYPETTDQLALTGILFQRSSNVVGFGYSPGTNSLSGARTLGYHWNNEAATFNWNSGLVPPLTQWSLVALVVTPSNTTIYVANTNGIRSAVHDHTNVVQSFTGPITIGADPALANRVFVGRIDEVAVFDQALSANQIAFLLTSASGLSNFPPSIAAQSGSTTLYEHQTAQFTVEAQGDSPLSYQWKKGTNAIYVDVVNDSRISGAATAMLTISNLALSDDADYIVTVTNVFGSIDSAIIDLTVQEVSPATNIVNSVSQPAGEDWETTTAWVPAGAASQLAAQYYGSTFIILSNGGLRTPNFGNPGTPTSSSFPGDVLRVEGDGIVDFGLTHAGAVRFKGGNPATHYFKKLVLAGGQISSILNSGQSAIMTGELNVISNSVIWAADDTSPRSITVESLLTGDGRLEWVGYNTFTTFQAGSTASLNINNAANTFSGAWHVVRGTLVGSAPNALGTNTITVEIAGAAQATYGINNPNGDLILNDGRFNLAQNHTFRRLTVNGNTVFAGTYTRQDLADMGYGANFPATWTGVTGALSETSATGQITVLEPTIPVLEFSYSGGTLTLSWTNSAILLQATNVQGPWTTNGAASPYVVPLDAPRKFFLLQAN